MRQLRRCRKLRCAESLLHTTIAMTRASMLCAAAWSQQRARPIWRLACCFGGQSLRRSALRAMHVCRASCLPAGFTPMEVSEEDKGTCNLNDEPGL